MVVIYGIFLVVLLLVYYYSKKKTVKTVFVQCVEAGPTSEVDAEELQHLSFYDRDTTLRGLDGEVLDNNRYVRLIVKGKCMSERNIMEGDLLVAEKMSSKDNLKRILEKDNILWLHINDTGMDKIRIFDGWDKDEMKTYYYKNGRKHPSSCNHQVTQLRGIVRYRV